MARFDKLEIGLFRLVSFAAGFLAFVFGLVQARYAQKAMLVYTRRIRPQDSSQVQRWVNEHPEFADTVRRFYTHSQESESTSRYVH